MGVARVVGFVVAVLSTACTGSGPSVVVAPSEPAGPALAPSASAPVSYAVDLTGAAQQRVEVAAVATHDGSDVQTWWMPVWTPGSYLVREYARHVEGVTAVGSDGRALTVRKTTKNRWDVDAAGQSAVTLRYGLYAADPSVRTNWVHADGAVIVGAATFVVPQGAEATPFEVALTLPADWSGSATSMAPRDPGGAPHRYLARDLDELVDAPILAGPLHTGAFEVAGVPHDLVRLGGDGRWDDARALADVARVVDVVSDFWGTIPYNRYSFLQVVTDGRGGLEHMDSTLMFFDADHASTDKGWRDWLGLVAHEYFHTWNVKRLRPRALQTYAYEEEQYTPSLWVAEGITSYYDDLLLVRAGLLPEDEHLARMADAFIDANGLPSAAVQSLRLASHDAWIKYYRPDADRVNSAVSYYRKGAVVGFALDIEIRRATAGRRSLDDVLRALWARFADQGYTEEDFRAVASEVAGVDLAPFFAAYVDGTAPVDLAPIVDWLGLVLDDDDDAGSPWLGIEASGMPWTVTRVRRDSPAHAAGLNAGDEVIAVGDRRVGAGAWSQVERELTVDASVNVLVARKGMVRTLTMQVAPRPRMVWSLRVDPDAGRAAALRRQAWWRGE